MTTMKWLLRREFWEHKGAMFWAPVVAASLMVLFVGGAFLFGTSHIPGEITHNGRAVHIGAAFHTIDAEKKQEIVSVIANAYLAPSAPLYAMLAFIAFFYCLGALHDERRDRSILFWKSLPVSDTQTVLSKVITACVVIPLLVIAASVIMSLALMLIAGLFLGFHGINMFGPVLSNGDFYLTPLRMVGLLPVYVLWALPTVGWLLMVSAWAKSKVFLWAVGTPIMAVLVVKWLDFLFGLRIDMDWFVQNVIMRGLVGLVPGHWFALAKVQPEAMVDNHAVSMGNVFTESWMTLATPGVWLGAIAGVAMILAATRLRRWKDEG